VCVCKLKLYCSQGATVSPPPQAKLQFALLLAIIIRGVYNKKEVRR